MSTEPRPLSWEQYARELGLLLQRHRVAAGLSQEALAHRAGLTRNYYQLLERGRLANGAPANPSVRALLRLANSLGVSGAELLPVASVDWE